MLILHQNYRMRKKEYLSELKARIQQLEDEKEQLTKENMTYKLNNNTPAVDPTVANAISGMFPSLFIIIILFSNKLIRGRSRTLRVARSP